jgi:hypothetical protein
MAGMEDDPKNPNAWWAVKLPNIRQMFMYMSNWQNFPKKRLYWLVPLMIAICGVEIFFFRWLTK